VWAWVLNSAGDIEVRRRSRARRPHCKATTWRHLLKCFNALPAIFSLPAQFRAVAGNAYSEFGLAATDAPSRLRVSMLLYGTYALFFPRKFVPLVAELFLQIIEFL
jgi:hypothetical protein